ncbi:oligosaccharide repeat unit polymerase [Marinilabiliaceae bacterium AAT]|uniref:Oligosaccharide repeat unit polymerase n=2 Tax=Plebeiibacterium sediminum TaxID=2992112 RepID=A0AAE3M406_9BACT|nr:oligosaccharide repeat unit polymerase [Plebeiobacterium sediminum]
MSYAKVFAGNSIAFITDILNIALFIYLIQSKKISSIISVIGKPVSVLFLVLIIVGLFSGIINSLSPITIFWGFRTFYRFSIFFLACIAVLSIEDIKYYNKWLPKILIINFAVSAIQYFILNERGDLNKGTLGDNSGLYILCYICLAYFILAYIYNRISLKTMFIYISLILLIAIFSELKVIFFLIPFTYILSIIIGKKSIKTVSSIIFISVFSFIGLFLITFFYGAKYTSFLTDQEEIQAYAFEAGHYNFQEGGLNRGTALTDIDNIFYHNNPIERYFGMGIGSASPSPLINSSFFNRYGSQLSYFYFLTSYLLIEQGWLGFLLYVTIWTILVFRLRNLKIKNEEFNFWKSFSIILLVQIILSIWYNASLVRDDCWFLFLYLSIPFIYYKQHLLRSKISHIIKNKNEID